MKNLTAIVFFTLFTAITAGQPSRQITLEECYILAKQNYPLVKQRDLIAKSKEYSLQNASKGYLPQVSVSGQATYQSDVTEIPIKLPNVSFESPGKDQYRIYGEVNQSLTDWAVIGAQKQIIEANAAVDGQKLEVELYRLKERINRLFFGILLINGQLAQVEFLKKDIQTGMDKMSAAVANGIALKSNVDVLKAELLKATQRIIELKAARDGYTGMLGLFINHSLNDSVKIEKPQSISVSENISRPELSLFENQKSIFALQRKLLSIKNFPRVNLFWQQGYGKPALNVLNPDFDSYYMGGIRFIWPFTGFYTIRKEKELLEINRSLIDVQKETFLFNTSMVLKQQNSELKKLEELLNTDNEIIVLRTNIKNTAKAQLENGTCTSSDYLREVNAEDMAKQNMLLHEIQLLMAQYNYRITTGN